jgi:hypothetical protein
VLARRPSASSGRRRARSGAELAPNRNQRGGKVLEQIAERQARIGLGGDERTLDRGEREARQMIGRLLVWTDPERDLHLVEEVRSVGDRLLVLLHWRRGGSPHSPMLASIYLLMKVDDSQITDIRVFLDEHAAIEAERD